MLDYRSYQRKLESEAGRRLVWGSGTPAARCVLLGLRPHPEEDRPFTVGGGMYLRHVLGSMGVPHQFVFFSYVIKSPDPVAPGWEDETWGWDAPYEIGTYLRPAAVVCLGLDAYNAVAAGGNRPGRRAVQVTDIEQVRRTRIAVRSVQDTNFFVTYAPDDVLRAEESGNPDLSVAWRNDLSAVFNVTPKHFMKLREVD
jgi:uracil-DNA glycosylase